MVENIRKTYYHQASNEKQHCPPKKKDLFIYLHTSENGQYGVLATSGNLLIHLSVTQVCRFLENACVNFFLLKQKYSFMNS